jgi:hypothetical protein
MKKDNFIWWIVGGIAAYALYRYYKNKNVVKVNDSINLVEEVLDEEEIKYPEPFLAQYNLVLPADMVSKRVKAKGEELRSGRYAIQAQRINEPVYI